MSAKALCAALEILLCSASILVGCRQAQPPATAEANSAPDSVPVIDDARGAADASLGKQSEIVLRGNLAMSGREQILVVNRYSAGGQAGTKSPAIFAMRAAVLEKNGGQWSEVLLCDEHLKNPNGYLGSSTSARVTGWRLEYNIDEAKGLEMRFTPAENSSLNKQNGDADQVSGSATPTFEVRWNKKTKRYQTFDQSHERFLSEIPSLETPQSILK